MLVLGVPLIVPKNENPQKVNNIAKSLSSRAFRGNRQSIKQKTKHIINMSEAIRLRWDVHPYDWQVKHLRWFLEVWISDRAPGTKYRYFRYLREILIFQNHWDDWKGYLKGPWCEP